MDMEKRKLSQEEICDIVAGASDTISKKLDAGAVIVPKLIKAALNFYLWLSSNEQIQTEEGTSRDVIAEMLENEMKKRVE